MPGVVGRFGIGGAMLRPSRWPVRAETAAMVTIGDSRGAAARAPRLPVWKKLIFAIVPLLVVLGSLELIARLVRDPLCFESYRLLRVDQVRRGYPALPHPVLGYVPKPSFRSRDNHWGTLVSIDADGYRSNGAAATPPGVPIVAAGDSFTFGDQVDDGETWPAYLQEALARPVVNAGVFGYSIGQAVLRAEEVLDRVPADWLVLSFVPGDIERCELSKRYAPKPYFDVVDGELVLCNVPVSEGLSAEARRLRGVKNALGHSALLDAIFATAWKAWWVTDEKNVRVHPQGKGVVIAKLLVDRIAEVCRQRGCRLLLLAQGEGANQPTLELLAHARSTGVHVLDLIAAFQRVVRRDPGALERYFDGHMTAAGNLWVAERVAEVLEVLGNSAKPVLSLADAIRRAEAVATGSVVEASLDVEPQGEGLDVRYRVRTAVEGAVRDVRVDPRTGAVSDLGQWADG